jgi:predicted aspartyl protease
VRVYLPLCMLAACQSAPETCQLAKVSSMPIHVGGGHIMIDAAINGHPVNLVVDTGADFTGISAAAANRMRMHADRRTIGMAIGFGGWRSFGEITIPNLSINELHGSNMHLAVFGWQDEAHPYTLGQENGRQIDGILGMDILSHYDLDFDLAGGKLNFYQEFTNCHQPVTSLPQPLYSEELQNTAYDGQWRHIIVTVNGIELQAMFDTGAYITTIYGSGAYTLKVTQEMLRQAPQRPMGGIGGRIVAATELLESASVGALSVHNMPVAVIGQNGPGNDDMVLGGDFLTKVHVWMSNSSHMLILQYPPQPSPPS